MLDQFDDSGDRPDQLKSTRDGLLGSELLKQMGGRVVAQHADGCTVFGMPKAVIEAGIADRVVKLPHLAAVVCDEVKRGVQHKG